MAKSIKNLELGESLVIEKIQDLKRSFSKALSSTKKLKVVSSEINEIDLTGVQLLQHMIRISQLRKVELIFDLSIPVEQQLMFKKNGFSDLLEIITK